MVLIIIELPHFLFHFKPLRKEIETSHNKHKHSHRAKKCWSGSAYFMVLNGTYAAVAVMMKIGVFLLNLTGTGFTQVGEGGWSFSIIIRKPDNMQLDFIVS